MGAVLLNGKKLKFEHLNQTSDLTGCTPFEREVIEFISQWQSGTKKFKIMTSGSTGKAKSVLLERDKMILSAGITAKTLGLKSGMTALLCLHQHYIAGKMMIIRALEHNMDLIAITPSSNPLQELTNDSTIDFAAFVPLQMAGMLRAGYTGKLNKMHVIIVGGAPLSLLLEEQIMELTVPVYLTYGMTETYSHVALKRINGPDKSTFYHALGDVVFEQDNRDCLTIKGEITDGKEMITNDIVELKSPKEFVWIGRYDHIINSGGIKINPESVEKEIERIFRKEGIENRFLLTGLPNEKFGQILALVMEDIPDHTGLLLLLKSNLPEYEVPKSVYVLKEFVTSPSGKINRSLTVAKIVMA